MLTRRGRLKVSFIDMRRSSMLPFPSLLIPQERLKWTSVTTVGLKRQISEIVPNVL